MTTGTEEEEKEDHGDRGGLERGERKCRVWMDRWMLSGNTTLIGSTCNIIIVVVVTNNKGFKTNHSVLDGDEEWRLGWDGLMNHIQAVGYASSSTKICNTSCDGRRGRLLLAC
jgi:hypothetical protein